MFSEFAKAAHSSDRTRFTELLNQALEAKKHSGDESFLKDALFAITAWSCSEEQLAMADNVLALIDDIDSPRGPKGDTPAFVLSAQLGRLEMMKKLVKRGADINARGHYQQTALIEVASRAYVDKSLEIMKWLLNQGADADAVTAKKRSALIVATLHNNLAAVRELLVYGVDTEIEDANGWTALDYSRMLEFDEIGREFEERQDAAV